MDPRVKRLFQATLYETGAVTIDAEKDLGDTMRLRQALAGFGLTAPPVMVGHPNIRPVAVPPPEPVPLSARTEHGDEDEALVQKLYDVWVSCRSNSRDSFREVVAHLRAEGLMRTKAETVAAENVRTELDAAVEQNGRLIARAGKAEHDLDVAQAQVRALTAKAEEANFRFEQEVLKTELQKKRADEAVEEMRQERERANKAWNERRELSNALQREQEARKAAEALVRNCPKWEDGMPVTQGEWNVERDLANRVPALESEVARLTAQVEEAQATLTQVREIARIEREKAERPQLDMHRG